ncbi:MAG: hypothetical protein N2Z72_06205 [Bacteroidales bacterium]|nr:hypothetical protein [Bacteroidales bacterium]
MKKSIFLVRMVGILFFTMPHKFFSQNNFSFSDITFWIGNGPYKAALVVDFNDNLQPECFVWGYRFNDTTNTDAEDMFHDIDSVDAGLSFIIQGGFLMSAYYGSHQAIGGTNNYYFATFNSPKVFGNWIMNSGLSEILKDSLWFGASFTPWDSNFLPVYLPENPVPANNPASLVSFKVPRSYIHPNPLKEKGFIKHNVSRIDVFSLDGRKIGEIYPNNHVFDIENFETGPVIFRWIEGKVPYSELILIQK